MYEVYKEPSTARICYGVHDENDAGRLEHQPNAFSWTIRIRYSASEEAKHDATESRGTSGTAAGCGLTTAIDCRSLAG